MHPGTIAAESPDKVAYVMADSDQTGGKLRTSFADLTFHRSPPPEMR